METQQGTIGGDGVARRTEDGLIIVYKSDSVNDSATKVFSGFKVGQSCTITGMVVQARDEWVAATTDDILSGDSDVCYKGEKVWELVKSRMAAKGETRKFDAKNNGDRWSIWRKA